MQQSRVTAELINFPDSLCEPGGLSVWREKTEPVHYFATKWKSYNDAMKWRGSLLVWLDRDIDWLTPHAGLVALIEWWSRFPLPRAMPRPR